MKTFKALRINQKDGKYAASIEDQGIDDLPAGDLLIRVEYSSLNFKDVLVAGGARGLTREYPHTPGIDAAGVVEESGSSGFASGDKVLVTGFDLGINTPGGFGRYIRVPADWALKIPEGLDGRDAMAYGTAGLTAGMSIREIEAAGIAPSSGPVAVTGASGGVGSLAISMLKKAGYSVAAVTNKSDDGERLTGLGADEIISSDSLAEASPKHLLKPRWSAVVDTVGGTILANLIKETRYGGVVTNCGMVAGNEMNTSVFPFLIRAVRLIGIDSVLCPIGIRKEVWEKIASQWHDENVSGAYTEVALKNLPEAIARKNEGKLRGRVLVNLTDAE